MENPTDPTPFSIKFFTSNYGTNIKFLGLSPVPGAYQTEEADAPEKFARGLGYDLSNLHWNENPSLIVSTTTDEELESLEIKDFDFSFAHCGTSTSSAFPAKKARRLSATEDSHSSSIESSGASMPITKS